MKHLLMKPTLFLFLTLATTIYAQQNCVQSTFKNNRTYTLCNSLRRLGASIHWTYHPSNGTADIAYRAPQSASGWVSWAINPQSSSMIGSQALIAFPASNGALTVFSVSLVSYAPTIKNESLSFPVFSREAEYGNGIMTIYASIGVPENATRVNQVWQAGTVFSNGLPSSHATAGDNAWSMGTLNFLSGTASATTLPSPGPVSFGQGLPPILDPTAGVHIKISSNKKERRIIATLVSLVIGTLLLACIMYCICRKKKRIRKDLYNAENWNEDEDLELPLYDLETLIAATDNFAAANKLGEGGYGPVYKGIIQGDKEIAIKRLSKDSNQGVDEFKNEVLLIAKLQHRNLVRLVGCCTQGEERMLINEYMHNKSLDTFLFDKTGGVSLDWPTRYRIIKGIARGLLYLHQDSRFRIIHKDLKTSNVLLDKDMNPKMSDFGLARIFGGDEATTRTRRVVGTCGYMSPEYAMDGIFSIKSDVFSFGVIVLEIVSGERSKGVFLGEPQSNLLMKAWRLLTEDRGKELIDPFMGPDFSLDEIMKCIKVGVLCVQEKPETRPTMSSVVVMLSDHQDVSVCQPQEPGFAARKDPSFPNSPLNNDDIFTTNSISFSMEVRR